MTATPRTSCSPGISRSTTRATRRVKAGLNVSKGVTSEASALDSACEESRLAAQLSRAEPRSAATNTASICGQCAEQERDRRSVSIVHSVKKSVPIASRGREAALLAHATSAGRAYRSSSLLRIGSIDVRTVVLSVTKDEVICLPY